jgi:hypothetical protein
MANETFQDIEQLEADLWKALESRNIGKSNGLFYRRAPTLSCRQPHAIGSQIPDTSER